MAITFRCLAISWLVFLIIVVASVFYITTSEQLSSLQEQNLKCSTQKKKTSTNLRSKIQQVKTQLQEGQQINTRLKKELDLHLTQEKSRLARKEILRKKKLARQQELQAKRALKEKQVQDYCQYYSQERFPTSYNDLAVMLFTSSDQYSSRCFAAAVSWASHFPNLIFVGSNTTPPETIHFASLNTIRFPIGKMKHPYIVKGYTQDYLNEDGSNYGIPFYPQIPPPIELVNSKDDYASHIYKHAYGLQRLFDKYPNAKWFVIGGDDTWINVERLRHYTAQYDHNLDYYMGYKMYAPTNDLGSFIYASGGCVIISQSLMKKVYSVMDQYLPTSIQWDDVWFGHLLKKQLNVLLTETNLLLPFPPEVYLPGMPGDEEMKRIVYKYDEENTISYHYVYPSKLFTLEPKILVDLYDKSLLKKECDTRKIIPTEIREHLMQLYKNQANRQAKLLATWYMHVQDFFNKPTTNSSTIVSK